MNKKQKKENRKILISIVAIVLLICLLAMGTFSYLTYNSTKEIDKYQAELKANNIIDNANYINITNFGEVNSFVVGNLHNYSDTDENSTYVILKNNYYNLSVDNANKLYIKTENYYTSLDYFTADSRVTYNYGLGNYLDYFTLRNSMTDEQYNKICDYLNTEPDENGNYYILSVNQYAIDIFSEASSEEMIPIRLEILLTNENNVWYAQDKHIEYFDLSSEKISKMKEIQKEDEENYKKYQIESEDDLYSLPVQIGPILSVGKMSKNEVTKDFFINGGKENELKKFSESNSLDDENYETYIPQDNFSFIYTQIEYTNPNYVLASNYYEGEVITENDLTAYEQKKCKIISYQKYEPLKESMPTLIIGNCIILVFFIVIGTMLILIVWKNITGRAIREQQRIAMTNAVAHNLKTPLCVINGFSENLREEDGYLTKQHYIDVIQQQAGDMDALVHKMLNFSKLESDSAKVNKQLFNIKTELETLAERYNSITDKNIIITADNTDVSADKALMELVFENLIENAVKYSKDNSDIKISFANNNFNISNECEEISKKDLKKIWKPYNRLEKDEEVRGTGIGLSIVKHILKLHRIKPYTEYSGGRLIIGFYI